MKWKIKIKKFKIIKKYSFKNKKRKTFLIFNLIAEVIKLIQNKINKKWKTKIKKISLLHLKNKVKNLMMKIKIKQNHISIWKIFMKKISLWMIKKFKIQQPFINYNFWILENFLILGLMIKEMGVYFYLILMNI